LVILAALPDLLDGALAKASNASSQRGAFFDSTVDRITDALLLGGIAYYFAETRDPRLTLLPFAVSSLAFVISYQRAKAESLGLDAKGGLMERAERIVLLCIGLLLEPWFEDALVWILWGMLVLITITAIQRFVKVWNQAEVAPVTQARIDMRRERRENRRRIRTARRSTRVPLRERVPRRQD
jgi:CDP-diacylglycerol--glycerol-3-phosphate 3-phosphatidyltransferase